jgi:hypothetical protein
MEGIMLGAVCGDGEKRQLAFSSSKKWRLARALGALGALGALRRGASRFSDFPGD